MTKETDLQTLKLFNDKVARLGSTSLVAFLERDIPNVTATMENVTFEKVSETQVTMTGWVRSSLDNMDQDQIDAFVLTYRMFIQKNDRVSLSALAKIYNRDWMPAEANESFHEAMAQVNQYMASTPVVAFLAGPVTRSHLVDTIIYGGLAHTNPTKQGEYLSWSADGGATGFMWAEFIVTLQQMFAFLQFFKRLNEVVIVNCASDG